MFAKSTTLLLSALTVSAFLISPAMADEPMEEAYDCNAHAAHLDQMVGAEQALEAYHVLHGDLEDEHHAVEMLKTEHPDLEAELEDYVHQGCTETELEAHVHDGEDEMHEEEGMH